MVKIDLVIRKSQSLNSPMTCAVQYCHGSANQEYHLFTPEYGKSWWLPLCQLCSQKQLNYLWESNQDHILQAQVVKLPLPERRVFSDFANFKPTTTPSQTQVNLRPATPNGYSLTQCVYFIQNTKTREIKIGVATDPQGRLASLQIGSPHKLKLLAVIRQRGRAAEKELHERFKDASIRGEWFRPTEELLELIAEVKARS